MYKVIKAVTIHFYDGPVYRFGNLFKDRVVVHTRNAKSEADARNKLYYHAKKELGLDRTAKIELDDSLINSYQE